MKASHVVVIGGGYSGTLQAIQLLDRGARVTLIERGDRLGRGVAYSTCHADHLLNVRAAGMSAFPDRADHFAAWFEEQGEGDRNGFAQRRSYGRYIAGLLAAAQEGAGPRLAIRISEAVDVTSDGAGETVHLAGGERIAADAVVLALGNLPAGAPRVVAAAGLTEGIHQPDPWSADIAAGLGPDDNVLLIGTGLTAIDAVVLLDSQGFRGRILAISRRGLLPRAHADQPIAPADPRDVPEPRCTALTRYVRARAAQVGWRVAVDSLRPATQALWAGASVAERRRFLRHLRPWWDVHRHRIAPEIAARLQGLIGQGRLEIAAGRIVSLRAEGAFAGLQWHPRGGKSERSLIVRRIVDCTGPQADITRAGEPLLDALLASGRIRTDRCRIGVDVDARCRTLSAGGVASDTLRAVGPISKGAFWEIVAVPDIRAQLSSVAEALVV